MKLDSSSEDSILQKIAAEAGLSSKRRHSQAPLLLGIGDDAALFQPLPGYETVLTCDWFLEGTHFLRDKHPPDSIGWKCLARAVSDVAAMGALPRCFLLSLTLPSSLVSHWLDGFLGGLRRASRKFQCALVGGDTTRRDQVLINITVVGEVRKRRALLRSGARPGDLIYVSGRLGEAELGLRIQKQRKKVAKATNRLTRKHLYPEPRVALGKWLSDARVASSMIDISDGLSSDLPRLCAASCVGAVIQEVRLPLARTHEARSFRESDRLCAALDGGDDYELLFTVPPSRANRIPRGIAGAAVTRIGAITARREVVLLSEEGSKDTLRARGWDPFRRD